MFYLGEIDNLKPKGAGKGNQAERALESEEFLKKRERVRLRLPWLRFLKKRVGLRLPRNLKFLKKRVLEKGKPAKQLNQQRRLLKLLWKKKFLASILSQLEMNQLSETVLIESVSPVVKSRLKERKLKD